MPKRLTKSAVDNAKPAPKDYFLWDSELKGFGLKVSAGGRKSYVVKYRAGIGRTAPSRRVTIGAHGSPWTPDTARKRAREILGEAANGRDPALERQAAKRIPTLTILCDEYLAEGVATKKASTLATDKGRIERHIKPLLGSKRVDAINRQTVKRFLADVAAGKTATDERTGKFGRARVTGGEGTATRTVGLLGGILNFAIDRGYIDSNPARGVKRFADKKSNRFLTLPEIQRLNEAMEAERKAGTNVQALNIISLLLLTGARRGEIAGLRWSEIDFDNQCLRLDDSKTGQTVRVINETALNILRDIPREQGSEFVFPASRSNGPYTGTPKVWRKLRERAGLDDVRIHDLRHSFASILVSGGASLPLIGALLGHKDSATTQRYAHLHNDALRLASAQVSKAVLQRKF